MKLKTIDELVKHFPECKNIFSKGGTLSTFAIVAAIIGSVSGVSAQMLIECSGQVFLKRGSSEYRLTGVGERLQPGDRLFPQSGAIAKVLCENSDTWRVPVGIPSSINSGCPTWIASVVKGETRYRPGGSNPQIPYILHPRMTYLLHDRPTFRWNGVEGVNSYTVRLLGPGRLEWQTKVSSTEVVYPNDAPPLDWGVKYLVTVEANNGSSSLQDGGGILGFELLNEYDIQNVQAKAARIVGLEELTEEQRAFALAETYSREGLMANAIATLEELVEQGSQNALVFRMLGDLYAEVGLNLLAEARYERASEVFASTSNRYAMTATQDGLARVKLMLGKERQAERLSTEVIAEYRELGDEQSATSLEQRLAEPPAIPPENIDPSSVTLIITPRD